MSLAERLNHSRALRAAIVFAAGTALVLRVWDQRWAAVDLTFVILLFLTLGIALHRDLVTYIAALAGGGRAVVGIIIQFPLYAGIQGVMAGAGLATAISGFFVDAAGWGIEACGLPAGFSFPTAALLSAGLVNFFVPSGGGQWIVQGPIMCSAARELGLPLGQTVMAVAYGDQLTNMIQPFWAIPLMGLTSVNVRRFIGYCALMMIVTAPLFVVALWFYR